MSACIGPRPQAIAERCAAQALQRLLAEKVPLDLADPRGRTALHRCAARRSGDPSEREPKSAERILFLGGGGPY